MVPWEDKHHHCKCPHSLFFSSLYIVTWGHRSGISLWLSWLCLLTAWQCGKQARPWPWVSPGELSKYRNISLLSSLGSAHIQNTAPFQALKKTSCTPAQSSTLPCLSSTQLWHSAVLIKKSRVVVSHIEILLMFEGSGVCLKHPSYCNSRSVHGRETQSGNILTWCGICEVTVNFTIDLQNSHPRKDLTFYRGY